MEQSKSATPARPKSGKKQSTAANNEVNHANQAARQNEQPASRRSQPGQGAAERLLARFPVITFLFATFAWSYVMWSTAGRVYTKLGDIALPNKLLRVIVGVGSIGPTLTALMCTMLIFGEEGVQALLRRFSNRHTLKWWAVIILPWISGALLLVLWQLYDRQVALFSLAEAKQLIVPALGQGFLAALAEELGWRGFLLPRLLKQLPALRAAMLTGIITAFWHGIMYYLGIPVAGRAAGAVLVPVPLMSLIPISLIHTWLYINNRGNLLLNIGFAISSTAAFILFHAPLHSGPDESRLFYSFLEVLLMNVVAIPAFIGLASSSMRHFGDPAEESIENESIDTKKRD